MQHMYVHCPTYAAAIPDREASDDAIVFGTDQGLERRFNEEVADHAVATLAHMSAKVWTVGERVPGAG
ncbi:hypothetical protein CSZ94_04315 [Janthinobacterium sp. ROICE36]|nr:hypothetical protein CSZ94_04315 [Janthinobacterium sp. ROICE36]